MRIPVSLARNSRGLAEVVKLWTPEKKFLTSLKGHTHWVEDGSQQHFLDCFSLIENANSHQRASNGLQSEIEASCMEFSELQQYANHLLAEACSWTHLQFSAGNVLLFWRNKLCARQEYF